MISTSSVLHCPSVSSRNIFFKFPPWFFGYGLWFPPLVCFSAQLNFCLHFPIGYLGVYTLEKGADIESREKAGKGQLSLAAKYGRKNVAQLLLKKGATIDSQDCDGYLYSARERCLWTWRGLWTFYYRMAQPVRTSLLIITSIGPNGQNVFLLENGADANWTDESGRTPLSSAAKKLQSNRCEAFSQLASGADDDSKNYTGRASLFWALFNE